MSTSERDTTPRIARQPLQTWETRPRRLILHHASGDALDAAVSAVVLAERAAHKSVSVFTHTHAATAELSTALSIAGVQHEQVGFAEALGDGLQAQFTFLRWALIGKPGARNALAVYVRSISRGRKEIGVADAIVAKSMPRFEATIMAWAKELRDAAGPPPNYGDLLAQLAALHQRLGLPRGEDTWRLANGKLRPSIRVLERGGTVADLERNVEELRGATLVGARAQRPKPIQVMNLHQTKGREADATVLMLQPSEFHGHESEPYPTGSRLLYVCLTRARERAHIVLPADSRTLHGLWAPFINACVAADLL